MKITFVLPPIDLTGGNKVVAIYAQELMRAGHFVTIVSPRHPPILFRDKLKSVAKRHGWPLKPKSPFDGLNLRYIVLDSHRPVTDDDVPNADVVVATWWETAEWVSKLSPEKGRKFYFIQHHEVFSYLPTRSRDTYRLPLRKIVIAKWLQEVMATEYGDNEVSIVPNSVDRFQFYSPPRTKNLTPTVGVLYATTDFKGLDTSLAAIKEVKRLMPGLQVISFGSQRRNPNFPLPRGSRFYLRPSQDQIREIYSECDLWLTCSRSEGFNLPALEAMACGTPVVSTKAGWPAEGVVDRVNGILAEVDDVEGIAKAMHWILTRANREWEFMSQGAYRTMTTSSWKESAQMFEKFLLAAHD